MGLSGRWPSKIATPSISVCFPYPRPTGPKLLDDAIVQDGVADHGKDEELRTDMLGLRRTRVNKMESSASARGPIRWVNTVKVKTRPTKAGDAV